MGGISFTEPLYMGGKITAGYKMNRLGLQMANTNVRLTEAEVLLQTDQAYVLCIRAKELGEVARSYKKLLEELQKNVDAAVRHGMKTRNDALKVQVKLNEAEMTLSQVDDGLQLSKMALAQLCGIGYDVAFTLADEKTEMTDLKDFVSVDTEVNMENALSSRKEVQNLELLGKVRS